MAYEVGSAFLQIVPSFQGVADAIDAEAAKWGDSAGQSFAETFNARVTSALESLPDARVDADTTEAQAKIEEIRADLEELSNQRLGIDISDDDALAKLEVLRADLDELKLDNPRIRVDVDAAQAEIELAALAVESASVGDSIHSIENDSGGAGGGLEALGSDAAESGGEMSTLAIAIIGVGTALVPIGGLFLGAFAAVPAIIAGALGAVGALFGALEPIFKTLSAPVSSGSGGSSAATAQSNATSERNATYSVEQAEQQLKDAQVNGAAAVTTAKENAATAIANANQKIISSEQALVSAEQSVTNAQWTEEQAQVAVAQARQQAANQLQDYNDQLKDGAIAQQQAQLNLQEAQVALAEAVAPGSTATAFQTAQAQINYAQAQQQVQDLNDQQSQLQTTASAAFAAGVEGAQSVIDAEHQLVLATQGVSSAIQDQQNAQTALQQAQADAAQQEITNTQSIANAERTMAENVENAQRSLQQALDNQKSAYQAAAISSASAAGSTETFAQEFAKLTPAGQAFVDFIKGPFESAFKGFSDQMQTGLLPGLQQGLTDILPFLNGLLPLFDGVAKGIGDSFQQIGQFIGSPKGASELTTIFKEANDSFGTLGGDLITLFEAFTSGGSQAGPIITAFTDGVTNLVNAFAKWVEDGGFQKFMQWLKDNGPAIVGAMGSFFKAVGDLLVALTPVGVVLDKVVGFISQLVSWATQTWQRFDEVAIAIGGALIVISEIVDPIQWVATGIALIVVAIIDLVAHWSQVWATIKQLAEDAWTFIDEWLVQPLVNFFTVSLPNALTAAQEWFAAFPGKVLAAIGDFASKVWSAIEVTTSWLDQHIGQPIINFVSALPAELEAAGAHIWDWIVDGFHAVLQDIANLWNDSLGKVSFSIPSWVPLIGGDHFGFPTITVPAFHSGGVVQGAPGVEQLALLMPGEIVTPAGVPLPTGGGNQNILNLTLNGIDMSNAQIVRNEVEKAFMDFADSMFPSKVA